MASILKRGKKFYAQYYLNTEQKRVNLITTSRQIAKKIRQIESALFQHKDIPLPTKTPYPVIIEKYFFYPASCRPSFILRRSSVAFSAASRPPIPFDSDHHLSPPLH